MNTKTQTDKAFFGPNGWYVATEDASGTHYQPDDGGRYESAAAALAAEHHEPGTWVDRDGTIYDSDTGDVIGQQSGRTLGRVRVVEVNKLYSVASVVKGDRSTIQVGQRCKKL